MQVSKGRTIRDQSTAVFESLKLKWEEKIHISVNTTNLKHTTMRWKVQQSNKSKKQ